MAFDPATWLYGLAPAFGERFEDVDGKFRGFASGENGFELVFEVVGGCLAEDSEVVNPIKDNSVGGEVVRRDGVERFLWPLVRFASRLFAGEAGGSVVGG